MRRRHIELRGGKSAWKLTNEFMTDQGEWINKVSYLQRGGMVIFNGETTPEEAQTVLDKIGVADFPLLCIHSGIGVENAPAQAGVTVIYVMPIDAKYEVMRKKLDGRRMSYEQAKAFLEDKS